MKRGEGGGVQDKNASPVEMATTFGEENENERREGRVKTASPVGKATLAEINVRGGGGCDRNASLL